MLSCPREAAIISAENEAIPFRQLPLGLAPAFSSSCEMLSLFALAANASGDRDWLSS